jgi:hypothetical protein
MKTIKRFLLVAILPCLIYSQASAFKHFEKPNTGGNGGGGGNSAPIDGGIVILLVAGLAFGAKKIYDKNKKSKEDLTTI